ncbi:hypothetical protein P22_2145 [Propionispora sp. 2/2-37]|uniref:YigZ family protein n=1 Tax=Propionispora sp. 2/2-37 TaxID=1677858 RepID=UPI0006BB8CE4|nr:YigZ family protein [Propionispora sp. 2/2-37]CUH96057.1 hypothetical protein P22_2145 [Propionispora sp. 2/2-37]
MLTSYRTVAGYGETVLEVNKSRFIIYVDRVETEESAQQFITRIKKKHWDATHNCSAYIIGEQEQYQKADDDGEPSGTAGRPILEVIKKAALRDTVAVVTRYFGGIKLGAGGLIRAYGKGAAAGLKAAGLVERVLYATVGIEIDYTLQGIVENHLRTGGYHILTKEYYERVNILTLERVGQEELFEAKINDWTAGTAKITHLDPQYLDIPLKSE